VQIGLKFFVEILLRIHCFAMRSGPGGAEPQRKLKPLVDKLVAMDREITFINTKFSRSPDSPEAFLNIRWAGRLAPAPDGSQIAFQSYSSSALGKTTLLGAEDARTPPDVMVLKAGREPVRLTDFNPQLSALRLGEVSEVSWYGGLKLRGVKTEMVIYPREGHLLAERSHQ
jgi:dipeptidyl aminopeptidase/acylaminoacyl peptidase